MTAVEWRPGCRGGFPIFSPNATTRLWTAGPLELAPCYGESAAEAHERVRELLGRGEFTVVDTAGGDWPFSADTVAGVLTWQDAALEILVR